MSDYTTIEIKQTSLVETKLINKVNINIGRVVLHQSVMISYQLVDVDGRIIKTAIMTIENDDYKKWSSDDTYLENLVLSRLGYVRR